MIELKTLDGETVYLNPSHVVIVRPMTGAAHTDKPASKLMLTEGLYLDVLGGAEDVALSLTTNISLSGEDS